MLEQKPRQSKMKKLETRNQELTRKVKELEEKLEGLEGRAEEREEVVQENGLALEHALKWDDEYKRHLATAWANRRCGDQYLNVKVLLVSWDSDDMGVATEVNLLHEVFSRLYRFEVSKFSIPDEHPTSALVSQVQRFIGESSANTLLIFYYSGHGGFHKERHDQIWSAIRNSGSPHIPACSIQPLFEEASQDAVLFKDTCLSADTAMIMAEHSKSGSITELIAASGFQTRAPGVGRNSFSYALIKELTRLSDQGPFSISDLYNRILSGLRNTPERLANTTPIHCTLTSDGDRKIMIEPHRDPIAQEGVKSQPYVHNIGLMTTRQVHSWSLDGQELLKWLLRAPKGIVGVELKSITQRIVD